MKTIANPYNDVHGKGDIYSWKEAPDYVLDIPAIEATFGATLMARDTTTAVGGFITTVSEADGVYVTVHLYRTPCTNVASSGRPRNPLVVSLNHPA